MSLAPDFEPQVTVRAPAKVNLTLRVGPVRADGFHPLETVYQAIGLYDDVTVSSSLTWSVEVEHLAPGLSASHIDLSEVPIGPDNIAVRAGQALTAHHGLSWCAHICIAKGIPVAAGLAGGSADAAATLVALDRLWDLQTSDDDLLAIAADLGSDVPFALLGGTAHGTGRGELVEPVDAVETQWFVVLPSVTGGLSTPEVYAEYDRGEVAENARPDDLLTALSIGSYLTQDLVHNDLTAPALRLKPELESTLALGEELGAEATLLSGSGPTVLFLAMDQGHAQELRSALIDRGHLQVLVAPGPVARAHVVDYA